MLLGVLLPQSQQKAVIESIPLAKYHGGSYGGKRHCPSLALIGGDKHELLAVGNTAGFQT
jgi:hypothetical protein